MVKTVSIIPGRNIPWIYAKKFIITYGISNPKEDI